MKVQHGPATVNAFQMHKSGDLPTTENVKPSRTKGKQWTDSRIERDEVHSSFQSAPKGGLFSCPRKRYGSHIFLGQLSDERSRPYVLRRVGQKPSLR